MNIMDYRNELRDIASNLYVKNKFDKIFLHSNRDPKALKECTTEIEKELYKNTILIPMDEDDWVSPCLSNELREIETEKSIFVWNYFATFQEKEVQSNKGEEKTGFVQSCSWASVGYDYILSRRNNLYLNKEEYDNIYFIDKPLAVKVEHVGSLGFLRKTIKKLPDDREKWIDNLIEKLLIDIQVESDISQIFVKEWILYKELLRELLSSYKYLTEEQKELL